MHSRVSIIMLVFKDEPAIDRSVDSVLRQTFESWELLVVIPGSIAGGLERLSRMAQEQKNVNILRVEHELGPGAARNVGLRHATGEMVTYLDSGDEYYPRYLEDVDRFRDRADVLLFAFDFIEDLASSRIETWDPTLHRRLMFLRNLSAPIAVAHRKGLSDTVGGFNERLQIGETWDFWKRLARTGADFLFLPLRSGLHHVPGREPRNNELHRDQRTRPGVAEIESSVDPTRPPITSMGRRNQKVLFASPHCYFEDTDAAKTTASMLKILSQLGFTCEAFCITPQQDKPKSELMRLLAECGIAHEERESLCGTHTARILYADADNLPVTLFQVESSRRGDFSPKELAAYAVFYEKCLETFEPDVLLTYDAERGADLIGDAIIQLAKLRDIPVVFRLYDHVYTAPEVFRDVDYCVVGTEFSRRDYRESLGLTCQVLPCPVDFAHALVQQHKPQYITIVDPSPTRGLYVLARILDQLARRRPDISFLIVERDGSWRKNLDIDLSHVRSVYSLPYPRDSREFLAMTRVLMAPGLGKEAFSSIAVEAMLNGIPVLASDRGALPEIVGKQALRIPIPRGYSWETAHAFPVPDSHDIEGWIEAIIRFHDDDSFYEQVSIESRQQAQRWHPDRLGPSYQKFFLGLDCQTGPPVLERPQETLESQSSRSARSFSPHRERSTKSRDRPEAFPDRVGAYKILRELARGPNAVVCEAVHEEHGQRVALKALWPRRRPSQDSLERFRCEARVAAGLSHRNIIPIVDAGEHMGVPFVTMPLIEGTALQSILRELIRDRHERLTTDDGLRELRISEAIESCDADELRSEFSKERITGRLSSLHATSEFRDDARLHAQAFVESAARMGLHIAEALRYMHSQGIVHRDVRPANLLLDNSGSTWLTGFGRSLPCSDETSVRMDWRPRGLAEMGKDFAKKTVDPREDVYGLGMTLYETLSLLRPNYMLPSALETIVLRSIAKEPCDRYPTMADLAEDLNRFVSGRDIEGLVGT